MSEQSLDDVRACVVDMAEELAKVLKYTSYVDGHALGFLGSIGLYYDPTYKTPSSGRRGLGKSSVNFKKMVLYPRGVLILHPDYSIDIEADSTYEQWIVYSKGRITEVEKQLMPLMRQEEHPWPKIKLGWANDLERRKGLVALANRGESYGLSNMLSPVPDRMRDDSYTPTTLATRPTFGVLPEKGKRSSNVQRRQM